MAGRNVLVTGASGFIGKRLVRRLVSKGYQVRCLVRPTSDISDLKLLDCSFITGDVVKTPNLLFDAVKGVDTAFHLAASTHLVRSRDLTRVNTAGTRNVLEACAGLTSPPTFVFVSSISAAGPNDGLRLLTECRICNPLSEYGFSKADCELWVREYSSRLPVSIVRPPIVLGEGDRQGLKMFRTIDNWGCHFVPGFADDLFSVIHADDLADALIAVAERGRRLDIEHASRGIYFAAGDEAFTFAELGNLIGTALGRTHTRIVRVPKPLMWLVAGMNELRGRVTGSPCYLNLDKFHEAFAGSWACSNQKLTTEVGFRISATILQRLEQTVEWYRQQDWLKRKQPVPPGHRQPLPGQPPTTSSIRPSSTVAQIHKVGK